uniref:Condensation domain-containing protein n=1 Tax=Candidatus Kentrum sp. UNK TaxID=2126344 RepID=A0A451AXN2_9GAMM|nr:MAG: Condensation domain-containing protein [Candidatus Kentron sp. UNK]VFK70647.1 MAG: Condensation domain-containing protein [Candidatus Kentron sp. UNK]
MGFAEEHRVSVFHVILGAFYCYFTRTGQREDFGLGLFTLNRNTAEFKQTAGMFTKASPAWFRFGLDLNFAELVKEISKELQKDYRHQRLPISEITRQTGLDGHRVFDLTLSYAKHDYDANFNGNAQTGDMNLG